MRVEGAPMSGNREFLLKDWEAAHKSRDSYASMRLGVLGACLTILGLVVSLGKDATYPGIIGIWCVLLVIAFSGVRMLAAVNRAVYVFGSHMAALEAELGEVGFATCWGLHIKKGTRDTASSAFLVAIRLINACVAFLVAASTVAAGMAQDSLSSRVFMALFAAVALTCLVINERYIHREFDPKSFYPRIEEATRKMRELATSSMHKLPERLSSPDFQQGSPINLEERSGALETWSRGTAPNPYEAPVRQGVDGP